MKQLKTEVVAVRMTPETRITFDRICRKTGNTNQSEAFREIINTAAKRK